MNQPPRFSVIVPARNEEQFIDACLDSIDSAARPYPGQVERVVAINRCTDRTEEIARTRGAAIVHEDSRNLSKIRNAAAAHASGDIIVTIDADSTMSPNMLIEIEGALNSGRYIGGGVLVVPDRLSLGIVLTILVYAPWLAARYRVSAGLFWCFRKDFEAIGGFDETRISGEDIAFGLALKAYGKTGGKRFKTLWKAYIRTSCRKFDRFGDYYLLKNPRIVRDLVKGDSPESANSFHYDVER